MRNMHLLLSGSVFLTFLKPQIVLVSLFSSTNSSNHSPSGRSSRALSSLGEIPFRQVCWSVVNVVLFFCMCTRYRSHFSFDFNEIWHIHLKQFSYEAYWNSSISDSKWRIWRPFCFFRNTKKIIKNRRSHIYSSNFIISIAVTLSFIMQSFILNRFNMAELSAILSRYPRFWPKHVFLPTRNYI